MIVTVTLDDMGTVRDEGSVLSVVGTDEQGRRVRFAGDAEPMAAALRGVNDNGEAVVQVEDWMVLDGGEG